METHTTREVLKRIAHDQQDHSPRAPAHQMLTRKGTDDLKFRHSQSHTRLPRPILTRVVPPPPKPMSSATFRATPPHQPQFLQRPSSAPHPLSTVPSALRPDPLPAHLWVCVSARTPPPSPLPPVPSRFLNRKPECGPTMFLLTLAATPRPRNALNSTEQTNNEHEPNLQGTSPKISPLLKARR